MKQLSFIAAALLCFVTMAGAAIRPAQPGIGGGGSGSSSGSSTNQAQYLTGFRTGPTAMVARTNLMGFTTSTTVSNFSFNAGADTFTNLAAGYFYIDVGYNYYAVSNDVMKVMVQTNGVIAANLVAYSDYTTASAGSAVGTNFVKVSGIIYLPANSYVRVYSDWAESVAQTVQLYLGYVNAFGVSVGTVGGSGGGGSLATNGNQFGASPTLTLKDAVKLTNAIHEGISVFNGDSSNRANLIVKGAANPKLRITSVSPPQVIQLSSTEISTDAGGGQPYITISPEEFPTFRLNTNSLEVIGPGTDLGTAIVPWAYAYVLTNRTKSVHLNGGQAASSLVRLDSGTNLATVTIGGGLSFDGTTLTASGGGSSNYVTLGVGSIAVTNSSSVGSVALNGTNSVAVTIQAANSNSVALTQIVGILHKASASVIVLDCTHGNRFQVTNRLGQGTTFVVTNLAQGQEITIKGSADGTSRSVTVVPQLGFLVRDFDAFGVAAALNKAITATNGNTFEINIAAAWEHGTNWADVVTRQATY